MKREPGENPGQTRCRDSCLLSTAGLNSIHLNVSHCRYDGKVAADGEAGRPALKPNKYV